jgi:hypothetical protein
MQQSHILPLHFAVKAISPLRYAKERHGCPLHFATLSQRRCLELGWGGPNSQFTLFYTLNSRNFTEFCGISRNFAEFNGIPRYWTVKNFAELSEIKSIPSQILYSAELQKGTSENILIRSVENNLFFQ